MENDIILRKLEKIEQYIVGTKKVLNADELSAYTGFKKSYIYKLIHKKLIPYSKPNGKMLFFDREKVDLWLLTNKYNSSAEIEEDLFRYTSKRR